MCGVNPDASFSNARSTSSRNGVPDSDSSSVRLKYSAHSSDRVSPAASPLNAWPLICHRVRPSSPRAIVVEREARFLERLQVAADGARGDAAERSQIVNRDANVARPFHLTEDRPLPDDFGVPRHDRILQEVPPRGFRQD